MASYPPPPPPGYGPPPGQYYGPMRSTNGKAIAALVCGIAGFVVCPLTAVAAVILGPQARREIAAEPHRFEGDGLAKAGQIIGWVCLGFYVALLLFIAAIFVIGTAASTTSGVLPVAALAG